MCLRSMQAISMAQPPHSMGHLSRSGPQQRALQHARLTQQGMPKSTPAKKVRLHRTQRFAQLSLDRICHSVHMLTGDEN